MNMLRYLITLCLALLAGLAQASTSGVVVSQIYGGGGNTGATLRNDFVELFNAGAAPVSLNGWSVQYAAAGGTSWAVTPLTNVLLQPGQYYLVQQAQGAGGTVNLPSPDATGTVAMSATGGKVAVVSNSAALAGSNPAGGALVDLVGWGAANGFEGAAAPATVTNTTTTTAVQRAGLGCADTDNNAADFSAATPMPRNSGSALNACGVASAQPIVPSCSAATLAAGTAGSLSVSAADADSIVNALSVTGSLPAGFSLGAFTPAAADGASASQAIEVSSFAAAATYALQLQWSNNEGQAALCTFNVTISGVTAIYAIQGSGSTSPLAGQSVITSGVVTKLNNNGFFMQDASGDGNPATSDGIFVFTSTAPTVSVGQLVQLGATVVEFNTGAAGNADTLAHPVTELTNVSGLSVLSSGYAITPVEVVLPETFSDELERFEGMLVTLRGPLTVSQNFFQGRFGQVTLSVNGRLENPTNRHRPGADAQVLNTANLRASIVLDDGTSLQNPNPTPYFAADNTLRAGDTVAAVTGVIDYGLATSSNSDFGDYRIHPTSALSFVRANPRTAAPDAVGGNLKVGSANVLNFFTTFTDGNTATGQSGQGCTLGASTAASNCRGANNAAEFARQRSKIVESIAALGADVVGLMEIQNNGATAVQNLVDGLNAKLGGGTFARVPDPAGGTGTDAIKVALIYRPAKLSLVGAATSDSAAVHNRPPLAQTFAAPNGERFSVLVNHFKSKGCDGAAGADEDQGDLQGCFNARRVQQAQALRSFITAVQAASGSNDVLVLGDLNAYAQEDPVFELTSAGFVDLIGRFNSFGYSYVFNGAAGRLDHALATPTLSAKTSAATEWHINADEPSVIDYNTEFKQPACATCGPDYYSATPFRSSDHDPVLVGLNIVKTILGTAGRDVLVGTPGDDAISGGEGADTVTGGAGRDVFAYASMRDAGDAITDFLPGTDRIDMSALLASIGVPTGSAWTTGVVRLVASGANTLLQIDTDGSAGPAAPRLLATLRSVAPSSVDTARDLGVQ
ncbi:MAG: ExeM/NucH family extracellular endonuclease [Burkholderiales bacterium]|nr:ExeM/NucH family extracellular endonuclease [Burkholderiales bacterium]